MINFSVCSVDFLLISALDHYINENQIECECIGYSGGIGYNMERDDFDNFIKQHFHVTQKEHSS